MKILLENLGKKFRKEWIFRRVNLTFELGNNYTFVGPNGSGKSTLLQVLAGAMPHTDQAQQETWNDLQTCTSPGKECQAHPRSEQ